MYGKMDSSTSTTSCGTCTAHVRHMFQKVKASNFPLPPPPPSPDRGLSQSELELVIQYKPRWHRSPYCVQRSYARAKAYLARFDELFVRLQDNAFHLVGDSTHHIPRSRDAQAHYGGGGADPLSRSPSHTDYHIHRYAIQLNHKTCTL